MTRLPALLEALDGAQDEYDEIEQRRHRPRPHHTEEPHTSVAFPGVVVLAGTQETMLRSRGHHGTR